jgi:hypothetical protein
LRVLVVNEPGLAEGIVRLRGEWAERSGGELRTSAATWQDVVAQKAIDADLIVFPSRYLGELCVRNWLRPVRPSVLESEELGASDFFPIVRHELILWGGEVMALPLGVKPVGIGEATDSQPSLSLLARAAPAAMSKDRLGVLFDSQTMQPRITEAAFVEALTQLTALKKAGASGAPSSEVLVPVVGYSDRLIAVTASSRNAASAFKLLEWLAESEMSTQFARAGEGTLPVRRSLASSPSWYGSSLSAAERAEFGKTLEAALSQPTCLLVPRIPGVDEYLAALDQAVKDAVFDGAAPGVALAEAAQRWEEITDARGREAQRRAYLKHLGISEP